jgi:hypothetical protein
VPTEIAKKQKWRSLPLSNAILQGTASTAYGSDQGDLTKKYFNHLTLATATNF